MRKKITLLLLWVFYMTLGSTSAIAQSDENQLLIFRNTGETNLLFQSDVDSIILTRIDTLGVEHEEPIAQVFHTADTTLYVALAEIDSVCLASRNAIEYRSDVRVLEENLDMHWIVHYDGNNIYYKGDTPSDILPAVGRKLYFPEQTELFPFGLSAKVSSVVRANNEIAVAVSSIDYTEIFKKFFYAGKLDNIAPAMTKAHRAQIIDKGETVSATIDIADYGNITVDGRVGVHGNVVLNPFKHYYHAVIDIENAIGFSIKVNMLDRAEHSFERNLLHIYFPTIAAIFQPSIDVGLFVEINAELAFEYAMDRKTTTRIEWTRRNAKQEFKRSYTTEKGAQGNTAKTQIILDGNIFAGLQTAFNFDMVGDAVGAAAKMKIGTDFNGELSLGMLSDLSKEYDVSGYNKAELAIQSKLKFEGIGKYRTGWIWGNVKEVPILAYEHVISREKIDLFPNFFALRAATSPKKNKVSVSVKTKNEIAHEVEAGFQIVESEENPVPVDSIFAKFLEAKAEGGIQGVNAEMSIPKSLNSANDVILRPVFHYAGYTIPYNMTAAMTNPNIQPIVFHMTNGGAIVLSSYTFADNVTVDSTLYVIGAFVPVVKNDTVFHKVSPYAEISESYIYYEDAITLIGTWKGDIDGKEVTIAFSSENSCKCECADISMPNATYRVNEPQSGCILIDSIGNSIVLDAQGISHDSMVIRFKNSKYKGKECTLKRVNTKLADT